MAKYQIPIDVNPKYFPQVGELATRWGWIENQTGVLIRVLLRLTRPEGEMAIGNMGITAKTRVIASLAEHLLSSGKHSQLGADLIKVAEAIKKFDKFRNNVIHGLWVYFPKDSTEHALLSRESLLEKVTPHPNKDVLSHFPRKLQELREIQNEAQRLTRSLKALRGRFS